MKSNKTLNPICHALFCCLLAMSGHALANPEFVTQVIDTGKRTPDTQAIIFEGVGDGTTFVSMLEWQTSGPVNLVPDVRHPLLEPRAGKYRNIYAPSLVRYQGEWTIYYGGWDGIPEGHDHIYATTTTDFLTFGPRSTVIEPAGFDHVCNVNAQLDFTNPPAINMMVTVYPDAHGLNKPALFHLPQRIPASPLKATLADIIDITGYPNYPGADINGMNVLLQDLNTRRIYFGDFRNYKAVNMATAEPGTTSTFAWQSAALKQGMGVNDMKLVRSLISSQMPNYLMGLHTNSDKLYYSFSSGPGDFPPPKILLKNHDDADKYITSIGFASDSEDKVSNNIIGVLYGAGAKPSLDANRIFARWVQEPLEFVPAEGQPSLILLGALGPDMMVLRAEAETWTGQIQLRSPLRHGVRNVTSCTLTRGHVYRLESSIKK